MGPPTPQDEDIHGNHLDHSWPLHLDGHLLPVGGKHRPVDLSQGSSCHGLEGDLREYRPDGLPQFPLDDYIAKWDYTWDGATHASHGIGRNCMHRT